MWETVLWNLTVPSSLLSIRFFRAKSEKMQADLARLMITIWELCIFCFTCWARKKNGRKKERGRKGRREIGRKGRRKSTLFWGHQNARNQEAMWHSQPESKMKSLSCQELDWKGQEVDGTPALLGAHSVLQDGLRTYCFTQQQNTKYLGLKAEKSSLYSGKKWSISEVQPSWKLKNGQRMNKDIFCVACLILILRNINIFGVTHGNKWMKPCLRALIGLDQLLRTFAALVEDPNSVSSTHIRQFTIV